MADRVVMVTPGDDAAHRVLVVGDVRVPLAMTEAATVAVLLWRELSRDDRQRAVEQAMAPYAAGDG